MPLLRKFRFLVKHYLDVFLAVVQCLLLNFACRRNYRKIKEVDGPEVLPPAENLAEIQTEVLVQRRHPAKRYRNEHVIACLHPQPTEKDKFYLP